MAYGMTPYPVSPLAQLFEALSGGVQTYNQSREIAMQREAQQQALEMQRQQQELLRAEAARQAQIQDQQAAAQALQMGQWAQSAQGWQMLQAPEYQEAFRRAGGVLPIQSQQVVMPQGVPTPEQGSAPISAVSAVDTKNTYKLPEKPEDLWTVEEWYAKNGLPIPDEAQKYAKVPIQQALQAKLVNLTPPDPEAGAKKAQQVAREKLSFLLDVQKVPLAKLLLGDFGKGLVKQAGFEVAFDEAGQPYLPREADGVPTYREAGYTEQMIRPEYLDMPAHTDAQGNVLVRDYMQPVVPKDMSAALQTALTDLDGLTKDLANAVASGDEVNAVRYWGLLKSRRDKYAAEMPDVATLIPLEPIETVKQNAKTVKTEKAQAKIGVDAGERLQQMRVEAYEKANRLGVNALNPGQRLLINADDNLLQTAIGLAQRDPVVQALAFQAMGGQAGQEKYNKALDAGIAKYLVQLQKGSGLNTIPTPQPGATPAPTPKPTPSPQGAQQPGLLKGTKPAPAKGKDARTPAEKQKRTDAVRQIIGQAKAAIGAKKLTKQQALQLFMQESRWYDAAEIDWVKREINKMK
jgi:hypothetical protein